MKFQTIGVLGGGQLGRMMAFAARRMGLHIAVLDPDPDAPACQIADRHVVGNFRDPAKIRELAQGCDVITVEIEHVETETLDVLEREGVSVQPSPRTIRLIQDKLAQKTHLAARGIPVAAFRDTPDVEAIRGAGEAFGYPIMLKSRLLAYDGRGNAAIQAVQDLEAGLARLSGQKLYVENWVPFEKELAVMVVRSREGQTLTYPVVETFHKESVLRTVLAPAPIPAQVARNAAEIAARSVATLDGAGIFGVELFLLPGGDILVNEIAPRPHNTGHFTIEACLTSQFEQHLRAILGLPLGACDLKVGAAVMVNVLGAESGTLEDTLRPLDTALEIPGASLHWYNKKNVQARRKMGHITVVGESLAALAPRLSGLTVIPIPPAPVVGIIMGSDSDLPTMKQAAEVLRDFGVPFELTIVSAHRTPQRMVEYAQSALERGLKAIIAGAGGAAHLPGMVAALTPLPVIGVPIRTEALGGQDSLLSIVQMPRGVPVATVAIGNATNAGLLAVRLLAAHDSALLGRIVAYQQQMAAGVMSKVEALARDGWESGKVGS
ncbi:MAG TPA: 5-(carboxyamino)imidazole ribonucleotide synthase [Aggregatilineales bacterium]|nr:5-(carboxyamino)imidazole ribonucleotide synthase [Aggregatilineales bacterium]